MKAAKIFTALFAAIALIFFTGFSASAEEADTSLYEQFNTDSLVDALDEKSLNTLKELGISSPDASGLSQASGTAIISVIIEMVKENMSAPIRALSSICAVLIIFSALEVLCDGLKTASMQQVMSAASTLAVIFVLASPIVELLASTISAVDNGAKFMLAYLPVITAVLAAAGNLLTSGSYYAVMVFACQGIAQLCSSIIMPLLSVFYGISVTGASCPVIKTDGFSSMISKLIKWILGFGMTLFSAMLSFKTMITAMADSVSTRAVRFSLSSFVPIVGSSLSEAYRTVQSSIQLLKSGIGIFAVAAVAVVFLPIVIQALLWMLSIGICSSAADILGCSQPRAVLSASYSVVSTILAVVLCVAAVFIISTTVILLAGGIG